MTPRHGLTIEQFLAGDWPPQTQLIDGTVVMNDPSFRHGEILVRILMALRNWIAYGGGHGRAGTEGNWTLGPGQVFKPDVWWSPDGRRPHPDDIRCDRPPAIAVEVWSPGTWRYDVGRKLEVYEQVGTDELWLVDTPRQTVILLSRSTPDSPIFDATVELGAADAITLPLLAGFSLAVGGLFTD